MLQSCRPPQMGHGIGNKHHLGAPLAQPPNQFPILACAGEERIEDIPIFSLAFQEAITPEENVSGVTYQSSRIELFNCRKRIETTNGIQERIGFFERTTRDGGIVVIECGYQPLQPVLWRNGVVVDERDQVARRPGNALVSSPRDPAAIAVENNDDFIRQPSLFRKPLLAQRERLPPESGNHDRDLVLISMEFQRSPS